MISFSGRYSKKVPGIFVFVLVLSLAQLLVNGEFLGQGVAEAKNNQEAIVSGKIRATIEVQNRHTDILMRISGVVGTGTGIGPDGQPAIKVLTMKTGIPGIPENIEGVPVDVVVTGMIVAFSDPTTRFDRPVPIGVSTGHPDITAGTIGCRVIDSNGNVYALSNNHVYANENKATIGDAVIQPGTFDDGSSPADDIGTLSDFEPLDFKGGDNTIDAAIALSSTTLLDKATPSDGYGTPNSTIHSAYGDPDVIGDEVLGSLLGKSVQKFGRTTGLTQGTITGVNATVNVCYECAGPRCFGCKKLATFYYQLIIEDGTFSAGGDSGSLIVTDDNNRNPVGLLFAGSSAYTIANQIDLVLNRFDVTVDDGTPSGCTGIDNDGDGWCVEDGDCDDNNVNIYPGAAETPYDGIDQDCSGADLTDVDGDGYDSTAVADGTDCDDYNAAVNPGAEEELYNGIDDDCDPSTPDTVDADVDGYNSDVDCNDNDPTVNPGVDEFCDDGIDNDCDGDVDEGCGGGCTTDADGDGYISEACGGDDCDDNDRHVNPGHNDSGGRWGRDEVDNDCNGIIDG